MKILLVNPSCLAGAGRDLYSGLLLGPLFTSQPNTRMSLGIPLSLPTLAAHTPSEHSVRIIDEEIETIDFDEPADIVGITAMTFKATRAYEIAREFRKRGAKVIIGGIHASMCPDEASQHVDCVVVGEADELWPIVLADAAAGELKPRYKADQFPDLKKCRAPLYELVKTRRYLYLYLQTTRGCPFDCNFCTVTKYNGRVVRKKTPQQVVEELDALIKLNPQRQFNVIRKGEGRTKRFVANVAFIDDNFAIDRGHALAICEALKQYQEDREVVIFWYTQVNFSVGFDGQLLSAMADANCLHLFIGFESLDPETIKSMKKRMNFPQEYQEAIRNIHEHGMRVVYSTIIGDDNTSQKSVYHLEEFVHRNKTMHVLLNVLTPYPGTELYEQMKRENRILTSDPQLYNVRNVVFQPKGMTPWQLQQLYALACKRLFRFEAVFQRGKPMLEVANQLRLPFVDRIAAWFGLSYSSVSIALQKRLRPSLAIRILLSAPLYMIFYGTIFAIELLITSVDYDDFACSEIKRLTK